MKKTVLREFLKKRAAKETPEVEVKPKKKSKKGDK